MQPGQVFVVQDYQSCTVMCQNCAILSPLNKILLVNTQDHQISYLTLFKTVFLTTVLL